MPETLNQEKHLMSTTSRNVRPRMARLAGLALTGLVAASLTGVPAAHAADVGAPSLPLLSPTATPSVSQNITFRAGEPGHISGAVEYRKAGTTETTLVTTKHTDAGFGHAYHTASLQALTPGTVYEYRVASHYAGLAKKWSDWRSFRTATTGLADHEFVVFGDTNEKAAGDSRWPGIVTDARTVSPKSRLSVHPGDMVQQPGTASHWKAWTNELVTPASANVLASVGENETAQVFLDGYKAVLSNPTNSPEKLEQATWYTDFQGVRFISLDSTVTDGRVAAQADWLDKALTNNPQRWTVVSIHDPLFKATDGSRNNGPALRTAYLDTIKDHNVDLVVSGHEGVHARGGLTASALNANVNSGPQFVTNTSGGVYGTLAPAATNDWVTGGATAKVTGQNIDTYQVVKVSQDTLKVETRVAAVGANPALFEDGQPVDASSLTPGSSLGATITYKNADGSEKVTAEPGTPSSDLPSWVGDLKNPVTPGGDDNGTGGDNTQTPGNTVTHAAVVVKKAKLKRGKKAKVKVLATVDGTVTVKLKRGKKVWTKKVKVKANKVRTVKFKKLTRSGPRKAVIRMTLNPTDPSIKTVKAKKYRNKIR